MSTVKTVSIIDGDNKFDLFTQLSDCDRIDDDDRDPFKFTVRDDISGFGQKAEIETLISGLAVIPGYRATKFTVTGLVLAESIEAIPWLEQFKDRWFKGMYDTRYRIGNLKVSL